MGRSAASAGAAKNQGGKFVAGTDHEHSALGPDGRACRHANPQNSHGRAWLAAGGISSLGLALTLFGVWWCVRRNRGPAQAFPFTTGRGQARRRFTIHFRAVFRLWEEAQGRSRLCRQEGQVPAVRPGVFVPAIKAEAP